MATSPRRFQVTSRLGAYADPMTDKVFYLDHVPHAGLFWRTALASTRTRASCSCWRSSSCCATNGSPSCARSARLHNLSPKANWSGKARTADFLPDHLRDLLLLQAPADWCLRFPANLVYAQEGLSVAINLISIGVYTARFWPALRAENAPAG